MLKEEMLAKAEGQKALNEAENLLNAEMAALRQTIARLEALPKIVEQMIKPAEKIKSIKVHHFSGGFGSGDSEASSPANATLESIMEMAAQLPSLRRLGKLVDSNIDDELKPASGKTTNQK
jgi:uncharacterized membrane protein YqiK